MAMEETAAGSGPAAPAPRPSWWQRIKRALSGDGLGHSPSAAFPVPSAHVDHVEDRTPLRDTAETAVHNHMIEREYQAEIERRKALWKAGEYTPRFFEPMYDATSDSWVPDLNTPNWHLELTQEPGRRADVTKDPGIPMQQPVPTLTIVDREVAHYAGKVDQLEGRKVLGESRRKTGRDLVGSREDILRACGYSVEAADRIERDACAMLGLTSLDDPLP